MIARTPQDHMSLRAAQADLYARAIGIKGAASGLGVSRRTIMRLRKRHHGGSPPKLPFVHGGGRPKLDLERARLMRVERKAGAKLVELEVKYEVSKRIVQRVLANETYREPGATA